MVAVDGEIGGAGAGNSHISGDQQMAASQRNGARNRKRDRVAVSDTGQGSPQRARSAISGAGYRDSDSPCSECEAKHGKNGVGK